MSQSNKPTAETMVREAAAAAREIFETAGRVLPMYHFVNYKGEHSIMNAPDTGGDKDLMVAMVRALFEIEHVIAYVYVDEAWALMTTTPGEAYKFAGRVKDHPQHQEGIVLMAEDRDGMASGWIPIERPKGARARLGELQVNATKEAEGRMVGLLPTPEVRH